MVCSGRCFLSLFKKQDNNLALYASFGCNSTEVPSFGCGELTGTNIFMLSAEKVPGLLLQILHETTVKDYEFSVSSKYYEDHSDFSPLSVPFTPFQTYTGFGNSELSIIIPVTWFTAKGMVTMTLSALQTCKIGEVEDFDSRNYAGDLTQLLGCDDESMYNMNDDGDCFEDPQVFETEFKRQTWSIYTCKQVSRYQQLQIDAKQYEDLIACKEMKLRIKRNFLMLAHEKTKDFALDNFDALQALEDDEDDVLLEFPKYCYEECLAYETDDYSIGQALSNMGSLGPVGCKSGFRVCNARSAMTTQSPDYDRDDTYAHPYYLNYLSPALYWISIDSSAPQEFEVCNPYEDVIRYLADVIRRYKYTFHESEFADLDHPHDAWAQGFGVENTDLTALQRAINNLPKEKTWGSGSDKLVCAFVGSTIKSDFVKYIPNYCVENEIFDLTKCTDGRLGFSRIYLKSSASTDTRVGYRCPPMSGVCNNTAEVYFSRFFGDTRGYGIPAKLEILNYEPGIDWVNYLQSLKSALDPGINYDAVWVKRSKVSKDYRERYISAW